eukprot:362828-Chlamydomonas_euryale.AAC.3
MDVCMDGPHEHMDACGWRGGWADEQVSEWMGSRGSFETGTAHVCVPPCALRMCAYRPAHSARVRAAPRAAHACATPHAPRTRAQGPTHRAPVHTAPGSAARTRWTHARTRTRPPRASSLAAPAQRTPPPAPPRVARTAPGRTRARRQRARDMRARRGCGTRTRASARGGPR